MSSDAKMGPYFAADAGSLAFNRLWRGEGQIILPKQLRKFSVLHYSFFRPRGEEFVFRHFNDTFPPIFRHHSHHRLLPNLKLNPGWDIRNHGETSSCQDSPVYL